MIVPGYFEKLYNALCLMKNIKPGLREDSSSFSLSQDNSELVLLSIRDQHGQVYICQGRGSNFYDAVEDAMAEYIYYSRRSESKPLAIRIDQVADKRSAQKNNELLDIYNERILYKSAVDGLAFGKDFDLIFLPEEIIWYNLIEGQKLNPANIALAAKTHIRLPPNEYDILKLEQPAKVPVYKLRFNSYYIDHNNVITLHEGSRAIKSVDQELVLESIKLTKDNYFKNISSKQGKFIYSYLPWLNKKEKRYNILRHAGTVYAMLETHELLPDTELLKKTEMALDFLIKRTAEFRLNGKDVAAVVEKDSIKLGGNALAIIALAKFTEVTGNQQYLCLMQKLAKWIVETQDQEGNFSIHIQDFETKEVRDFTSHYYPGEAILSLVRLYRLDGNINWLNAAEDCALYLIKIRDKDASIESIAHDHWLLYALNELYRERSNNIFLEHALFIARAIKQSQVTGEKNRPFVNGAYLIPHLRLESTPTAIRTEGLSAVYHLASDFGYKEEAALIKKSLAEGIRFQLQTQLRPEATFFYMDQKRSIGAFQKGLGKYDLRIDYTQHNISSLIAYYKIISHSQE